MCSIWIREVTFGRPIEKNGIYLNVIYYIIYKFKSISEEVTVEWEAKFIYIIGFRFSIENDKILN